MTASRGTLLYLLLSCLTISTLPLALYCGSNCIDYLGACYSAGYSNSGCIVCAPSIYNQNPDPTSRACILNNQTQVNQTIFSLFQLISKPQSHFKNSQALISPLLYAELGISAESIQQVTSSLKHTRHPPRIT